GFSPATTPRAMRIALFARWETRGSSEMTTRTGWPATRSVERQEPVGAVDDVGQDDQAAVGGAVGQRQPSLLAPVRAYEELEAAGGEGLEALVLDSGHRVVDQVQVDVGPAVERRPAQ